MVFVFNTKFAQFRGDGGKPLPTPAPPTPYRSSPIPPSVLVGVAWGRWLASSAIPRSTILRV